MWRNVIPKGLKSAYRPATKHYLPLFRTNSARDETLGTMLESVRVTTQGLRHTKGRQSAGAFLKYTNREKCRLLLNAVRSNASDQRRTQKTHLPTLHGIA